VHGDTKTYTLSVRLQAEPRKDKPLDDLLITATFAVVFL
jgi:hypothetical protein